MLLVDGLLELQDTRLNRKFSMAEIVFSTLPILLALCNAVVEYGVYLLRTTVADFISASFLCILCTKKIGRSM